MGLVDYSDSESEPEVQPKAPAKETKPNNSKFQKFVDRSNPGKILVNLPTASSAAETQAPSDEPPAKRARTTGGGSRFSGFSSFLPPPKTAAKPASSPAQSSSSSSGGNAAPRPGVHLKTGAEPAFSREQSSNDDYGEDGSTGGGGGAGGLKLPPPKNHNTGSASGPSIPADQIPAEEVKLVGKPLMFKPLSVSRKPVKKKTFKPSEPSGSATPKPPAEPSPAVPSPAPDQPKKKISLFSIGAETDSPTPADPSPSTGAYEPLFSTQDSADAVPAPTHNNDYSTPTYPHPTTTTTTSQPPPAPAPSHPQSLTSIADDLNLTPQARRELFGRGGQPPADNNVVNFDMSREYEHNETIRQSGEGGAAAHNPVRSIRAGKHSLRQLVNAVQSNASALEESFAAGKGKRGEAGARYGWR
ncbi:hypothetical protein CONLIGDRAFT_711879 [Coniochaeta ligniaria NRRL 30616]|uniref:Uncharacterized protein n=1 Tax=Coniochaeta ligniaria NRRL 30616 TaxID=1408157 RepID=A0A1J7JL20_9PEZI|nr:hypothetical protein CONLIGDRAFT_711879 [Coniochaeta ligniaria NRRL 30616]